MPVGKLNPSELANFAEIVVFLMVACPQNALLDGPNYLPPIVTPLELEAALLSDDDILSSPYPVGFETCSREIFLWKMTLRRARTETKRTLLLPCEGTGQCPSLGMEMRQVS